MTRKFPSYVGYPDLFPATVPEAPPTHALTQGLKRIHLVYPTNARVQLVGGYEGVAVGANGLYFRVSSNDDAFWRTNSRRYGLQIEYLDPSAAGNLQIVYKTDLVGDCRQSQADYTDRFVSSAWLAFGNTFTALGSTSLTKAKVLMSNYNRSTVHNIQVKVTAGAGGGTLIGTSNIIDVQALLPNTGSRSWIEFGGLNGNVVQGTGYIPEVWSDGSNTADGEQTMGPWTNNNSRGPTGRFRDSSGTWYGNAQGRGVNFALFGAEWEATTTIASFVDPYSSGWKTAYIEVPLRCQGSYTSYGNADFKITGDGAYVRRITLWGPNDHAFFLPTRSAAHWVADPVRVPPFRVLRYDSGIFSLATASNVTKSHQLGVLPDRVIMLLSGNSDMWQAVSHRGNVGTTVDTITHDDMRIVNAEGSTKNFQAFAEVDL